MDFDTFKKQLNQYLEPESHADCAEESNDGEVLTGPFDNFFGESLFLLLYHCDEPLSVELDAIRFMVLGLADISNPQRDRALFALGLAKFVRKQYSESASSNSSEIQLLKLATQLGNVQAHVELAVAKLRDAKLSLINESEGHPLPGVKNVNGSRKPRLFLSQLAIPSIWRAGADLALAASSDDFPGWTIEELTAAFACVVHFTVIPESLIEPLTLDCDEARQLRQWVVPLLKLLYQRICEIVGHDKLLLKNLRRQLHALQAVLAAAILGTHDSSASDAVSDADESVATVVVVKGVIPKSSDRSDNDILSQYEALRNPMKLAPMPTREQISKIQSTLEQEFPWATAAIEVIMSEIHARKRFGTNILGMQPVLLCGPPGTGKTRLSQRLADLLEIPSTVINMAGMTDTKTLKGVTRGWGSNRPSRIVESILHSGPSHMFLLDEVDKAHGHGTHAGEPQEALLDLLEPQNARRYSDIFLQTECDVSHCLYVLTSNSLRRITEPLLSRLSLAFVPPPGPEHSGVIAHGLLRDIELAWRIPSGALEITRNELQGLVGLPPRDMRRALMQILGGENTAQRFTLH